MHQTPNMALTVWDLSGDNFSHTTLAANLTRLDQHDHTPGYGIQISAGALATNAVANATIQDSAVTTAKINNLAVTTGKLADTSVTTAKLVDTSVTAAKLDPAVSSLFLPQYVSGAPLPSSPTDGKEVIFAANSGSGYMWRFRYRTAATKWEFIGGSPLEVTMATATRTGPGGTWGNPSEGTFPSITFPLAGDYRISAGARTGQGDNANGFAAIAYNGTTTPGTNSVILDEGSSYFDVVKTGVAANDTARIIFATSDATSRVYRDVWLKVTPIRVS